ncbi:MAG: hypothetical protein RL026_1250 [Pseudomonadota bacterium]
MSRLHWLGLCAMPCLVLAAEDPLSEIVVSATRAPGGLPRDLAGVSVTVLESATLQTRQLRTLADALRDVPGAAVNRAGPVGSVTQLRLRGSEANHVLVLVDGMSASDPFYGEVDFAGLLAVPGQRLEVLRGPQGALYGSDAIGGVVSVSTESGRESPGLAGHAETGSFATHAVALRAGGSSGVWDQAASLGWLGSGGASTARDGQRDLGADNRQLSWRADRQDPSGWTLRLRARYLRARAEFNQQDFDWTSPRYGYVVDTTDRSDTRIAQALVGLAREPTATGWHQDLGLQWLGAVRSSESFGVRDSRSEGERLRASWVGGQRRGDARDGLQWLLATDLQRESFANTGPWSTPEQRRRRDIDSAGVVAQVDRWWAGRWGLGAALRHDANERFSDATTWRLQGSARLAAAWRLHAAAATGVKNPTPTELFGYDPATFVGNPALRPELSQGWELGLEHAPDAARRLGLVWAESRLRHEIFTRYSPSFVASPDNRASLSTQRSLELTLAQALPAGLHADLAWTWLRAREAGEVEVRRPSRAGSLQLAWQPPGGRAGLQAGWRYSGRSADYNFTGVGPFLIDLPASHQVQLGGHWQWRPGWQLHARVENLLDDRHEQVYTYRMPGRAFHLGLRTTP